jgi:glucosamine-6-phosphate deaminase
MEPKKELINFDKLPVEIYRDFDAAGYAAAATAAEILRIAVKVRGSANLILATGNSMLSFLNSLRKANDIEWSKVRVFHMDEYVGMKADHPASFRRFLQEKIIDHVHPSEFFGINGDASDIEQECKRYSDLLNRYPSDLCCLGFGENGHLAFNDPPFANFNDPLWVKIVSLNVRSRLQQVGEGHFASLKDVPLRAITLTIPALLAARKVLGIVPEKRKAEAVKIALNGPISEDCPGSILRITEHARLFLDRDSASLLSGRPHINPN